MKHPDNRRYPRHIKAWQLAWALQKGQVVIYNNQRYRVEQALRSPVPGSYPRLILEKLEGSNAEKST